MFNRWGLNLILAWTGALVWAIGALTITQGFLSNLYGSGGLVSREGLYYYIGWYGFLLLVLGPMLLGLAYAKSWRCV